MSGDRIDSPGRARRLKDLGRRLGDLPLDWRRHLAPLVLLATLGLTVWLFIALAAEVGEGDTRALDERILLAMRVAGDPAEPRGPTWLEEAARDITALGSTTIVVLLTTIAAGYLWWSGRRRHGWLVVGAVLGGIATMHLLKIGFSRPRPDLVAHGVETYTLSFPSGHAMLSAVAFLTIAALLAQAEPRRRLGAYIIGVAIGLTILVGATRVYLGVHWPSDVVAGWFAGASWAMACWLLANWLRRHGAISDPGAPAQDGRPVSDRPRR